MMPSNIGLRHAAHHTPALVRSPSSGQPQPTKGSSLATQRARQFLCLSSVCLSLPRWWALIGRLELPNGLSECLQWCGDRLQERKVTKAMSLEHRRASTAPYLGSRSLFLKQKCAYLIEGLAWLSCGLACTLESSGALFIFYCVRCVSGWGWECS